MRIVILASSVYSETACAMAVRMAELGYVPTGALALRTLNRKSMLRKLGQWGGREIAKFALTKFPHPSHSRPGAHNSYLLPLLEHNGGYFRSLRQVAASYGFPVTVVNDQNALDSIAQLKNWSPDLIIFTGGNILRTPVLDLPRLGVINVHLGLLPEIRGMSAPEWSLLSHVLVGVTVHYMDAGIDTGPVLQRCEFPDTAQCESLSDLRNRLIAFGVEKAADVVTALDRGTICAVPQFELSNNENKEKDNQFYVMHEWLQARAAECLAESRTAAEVGAANG